MGNGNEMTMKIKLQTIYPGHETGEHKRGKEKRTKTNTNTPGPERANPERAREEKKRTDDRPNTDQRGGRTEAPDTTYKARAKPTPAREGPKPDLEREHA